MDLSRSVLTPAACAPRRTGTRFVAAAGSLFALAAQGCFGLGLRREPLPTPQEASVDVGTDAVETEMPAPDVQLPPCPPGQTRCGTSCFELQTDTFNCGSCGNACPTAGSVPASGFRCVMGRCEATCLTGTADCDRDPANGCEAQLTQSDNCGVCGRNCLTESPLRNVQAAVCMRSTGSCGGNACIPGFGDCNDYAADGCETNLLTNPQHCRGCGIGCMGAAGARPTCENGMCGLECQPGFADCDGNMGNGCETNIGADDTICSCAMGESMPTRCPSGQVCVRTARSSATPDAGAPDASADAGALDAGPRDGSSDGGADAGAVQVFGTCMSSCPAPLTMCGRRCVDAQRDPLACGASCSVCPAPENSRATCVTGTCSFECLPGFLNANGTSSDGCEVNTDGDVMNCGGLGRACPTGTRCLAGRCTIEELVSCMANATRLPASCDGMDANGCEVNLFSSTEHCGRCNNRCFADMGTRASCVMGSCNATCNEGFLNCDTSLANGCEVNKTNDRMNCGACGNACPMGQVCTAGVCAAM